jgi:hypothetical protein
MWTHAHRSAVAIEEIGALRYFLRLVTDNYLASQGATPGNLDYGFARTVHLTAPRRRTEC